ncbi:MAG: pilus assembly protein [Planctomycetota bacterium]|nr:pilus assembly protein [Planctomycetota bacterium]
MSFKTTGSRNRHGIRRRAGSATVELALTLSILLSICYGTIEYGYYFFVKNTMEGAAREGCRAGIVSGAANSDVTTAVINQLVAAGLLPANSLTTGNYTVTINPAGSPEAGLSVPNTPIGTTLTVQISATWSVVGSGFRPMALIGAGKTVLTASAMRKEG